MALPLLPLQALWTWPPSIATETTHGTPLIERQRQLAQEAAALAGERAATTQHTQEYAARVSIARCARFVRALGGAPDQRRAATEHALQARPAAVRAGVTAAQLTDDRVDQLITTAGAGGPPPGASQDLLRRVWARRALDTYSRWRHDAIEGAEGDTVSLALAKLSIGAPVTGEETQEFYVPYGLSTAASPLAGNNSAASELRVWTRAMRWTPATTIDAAATQLALDVPMCTPYDGVLELSPNRRAHAHPYILTLDHAARTLTVSINLETLTLPAAPDPVLEAAQQADRVRCIAFTAERLYQALQCASAYGASALTIDLRALEQPLPARFVASLALALGMLPNTSAQRFAIQLLGDAASWDGARNRLNDAAAALGTAMPTLALGEAAAAVAAVIG